MKQSTMIGLGIAAVVGAVGAYALGGHHAPGVMVSSVKRGKAYVLFVYAIPGKTAADVNTDLIFSHLGGLFSLVGSSPIVRMGQGVITYPDGTNVPAVSWGVQVVANFDADATTLQNNIRAAVDPDGKPAYEYQALQTA